MVKENEFIYKSADGKCASVTCADRCTTAVRLEIDKLSDASCGLFEWAVFSGYF